jgi:hypothetical protein
VAHALSIGADDIFIAISPGHAGFFDEVLQFEPCGGRREPRQFRVQVESFLDLRRIDGDLARGVESRERRENPHAREHASALTPYTTSS